MLQTMWGAVQGGHIRLSEQVDLPEGTKVLVTVLRDEDDQFWLDASRSSLEAIWNNAEDDVYGQLIEE